MKRALVIGSMLVLAMVVSLATTWAQSKTLAATMDVYVFPTKGQAADQQSQDEAGCYNWAVQNTGNDPFALAKQAQSDQKAAEQAQAQAAQVGKGAGADASQLDDLLVEAFAVVREAGRRTLAMRHFDVQLNGGIVLHRGKIAEMKTGEGKTLVATLSVYLNALEEKGVHVITVNDY